ncbi:hypothetical protein B0H12DRAFT_1151058 [Mycena haematopus]|nr:hypothetical protein B0H12DRAFT_1151058 [Mycena haematopus]
MDLPPELQREIFETAARADMGTALSLAVVSSGVQAWVEPIIYARIVVARNPALPIARPTGGKFIDSLRLSLRPRSFFARNVKSVLLGLLHPVELLLILSTCTGVTELGWWGARRIGPMVEAAMGALPLRRFAVDSTFLAPFHNIPDHTALTSTLAYLTHFDLNLVRLLLAGFPALTHFSLLYPAHLSTSDTIKVNTSAWADPVLAAAPRLCVFLLFCDAVYYEELDGLRPRSTDLRVVVRTSPREGEGGHRPGSRWFHDAWPLADEIVRDRKRARTLGGCSLRIGRGSWGDG